MSDEREKTIKALTICQPWAWAILHGPRDGVAWKRFENRGWQSDYVGPLVIHAGKSEAWMEDGMRFLREQGLSPLRSELVFGSILGVVEMVDCVRPASAVREDGSQDPYASGPYCHVYANPRRLAKPVPFKGKQGFYAVPRSLVAELLDGVAPAEPGATRESRIERAIEAAGGVGVLRPAAQAELFG